MSSDLILPLCLVLVGIFSMAGGIFAWKWLVRDMRSSLIEAFGRTGMRVTYSFIGAFLIFLGILIASR